MTHGIRLHRTGPPEVLQWETLEIGKPGPSEVLLQHRAIGVNFIDTYYRSGLYALPSLPSGLGMEAAGVILEVGEAVTEVAVGDRVAYVTGPPGSYAERRIVSEERLIPLPEDVDDRTAAAILLKAMTVQTLVERVHPVRAGETVLLHAAAGGVGLIACQWLSKLGARVLATVGSKQKAALARANGAAEVIDYTIEDFVARVSELTAGAGVSVVYDSVGLATYRGSLACLSPRGLLVLFGNASGKPDPIDPQDLASRGSLFLTRPVFHHYVATRPELLACARLVFDKLRRDEIRPHIGQEFALRNARAAHRTLESRTTTGSTLLDPSKI